MIIFVEIDEDKWALEVIWAEVEKPIDKYGKGNQSPSWLHFHLFVKPGPHLRALYVSLFEQVLIENLYIYQLCIKVLMHNVYGYDGHPCSLATVLSPQLGKSYANIPRGKFREMLRVKTPRKIRFLSKSKFSFLIYFINSLAKFTVVKFSKLFVLEKISIVSDMHLLYVCYYPTLEREEEKSCLKGKVYQISKFWLVKNWTEIPNL